MIHPLEKNKYKKIQDPYPLYTSLQPRLDLYQAILLAHASLISLFHLHDCLHCLYNLHVCLFARYDDFDGFSHFG